MEKKSRKFKSEKREVREFEQKTIDIARVARVMEGGRRFSFRATVVIGNRSGKVGLGVSKALNVAAAVEKSYADAKKNIVEFPLEGRTIPHAIAHKVGASKIILMPAKEGKGLVAGGSVRTVLELAGIKDVSGKILGSSNKINNARAAVEALKELADSFQSGGSKKKLEIKKSEIGEKQDIDENKENKAIESKAEEIIEADKKETGI